MVYVTPTGASSGTPGSVGTKANPASLSFGVTLSGPSAPLIRIAVGTYTLSAPLTLKDSIILEGGYLPAQGWAKTNGQRSIIARNNSNVETNPARLTAISAVNLGGFRLQDLEITVADAPSAGVTVYAVYINSCRDYTLSRCFITSGKGGDGINGTDGTNGAPGDVGEKGGPGCSRCNPGSLPTNTVAGGSGGSTWSSGAAAGGRGGDGGLRGTSTNCNFVTISCPGGDLCSPTQASAPNGQNGQAGSGAGAGAFGSGKAGLCYCNSGLNVLDITNFFNTCPTPMANIDFTGADGANGTDGADGVDGVNGTAAFTGGFFIPGDGTDGTNGVDGAGGGGGGGGASIGCIPRLGVLDDWNSSGAGGGGGGEGGQLGTRGTKGTGGGGSFGVFIWNGGPNGIIKDCVVNPGLAGTGGAGGAGGVGGPGGTGGLGGNAYRDNGFADQQASGCEGGAGGAGGNGGKGGDGGKGGNGSPGISRAIFQNQAGVPAAVFSIIKLPEPEITISNSGCGNSVLNISTSSTAGSLNWFVGGTSGSVNGANVSTEFPSKGYYNLSLFADGVPYTFTDFVFVDKDFNQPKITASAPTVCVGGSINFSTTAAGAFSYTWTIPGGSTTSSTQQNPGTISFNTAGTYNVQLQTNTCCGASKIDTLVVNVIPSVSVNLGGRDTICNTDPQLVLDAGGFPGATYQWTKNTAPIGGNTRTLTTTGAGDYAVTVSYSGGCSGTDQFTLDVISQLIVNVGNDVNLCPGDVPPILDAGNPNCSYFWTRNGQLVGTTRTLQTILPGVYRVTVTNPYGCIGVDEMQLNKSIPSVNLGPDLALCPLGGLPTLDAGPGVAFAWTLDGNSIGSSQTQQVTTSGRYIVRVTDTLGCVAADTVDYTIGAPLTAGFTPSQTSVLAGTPVTFTNTTSPSAPNNIWNFGDGTAIVSQLSPSHTFTTPGLYPVVLEASNSVCKDTAVVVIRVLADCSTLGLVADFSFAPDTVNLNASGLVQLANTSSNAIQYVWTMPDGSVVTSANPAFAFGQTGTYTIKLKAINNNCEDSITRTITVIQPQPSAIASQVEGWYASLFPNPASELLNVAITCPGQQNVECIIRDITGKTVYSQALEIKGSRSLQLNVSDWASGVYSFTLLGANQVLLTTKIVIE